MLSKLRGGIERVLSLFTRESKQRERYYVVTLENGTSVGVVALNPNHAAERVWDMQAPFEDVDKGVRLEGIVQVAEYPMPEWVERMGRPEFMSEFREVEDSGSA